MKNKPIFRRLLSLMLVIVLLGSMLPAVFAAEDTCGPPDESSPSATDPPEATEPEETLPAAVPPTTEPEETVPPATVPKEPAEPTVPPAADPPEADPTGTEPTEEPYYGLEQWAERYEYLISQESALDVEYVGDLNSQAGQEYSQISTYATGDTTPFRAYSVLTYAAITSGQKITFTYNGVTYSRSSLDLLGVDVDGDNKFALTEAAYCINPGLSTGTNYSGTEETGADSWGSLTKDQQKAIGLVLLYGAPNDLWSDDKKTELTYQLATAIIVHEICLGWRSSVAPYTRTNSTYWTTFYNNTVAFQGVIYTSTDGTVDKATLKYAYDYIVDKLAKHALTLSFASFTELSAPTHNMTAKSDGSYSISLTDTNGVLSQYTFTNTTGVTYTKSGNTLTVKVTSASKIPSTAIAPTRSMPSAEKSAYLVWNSSNGKGQEFVTVRTAKNDPVPAYFKLAAPNGKIKIVKTTNTGTDLGGFYFDIFDMNNNWICCGTTGSDGTWTSGDLAAGQYRIAEAIKDEEGNWSFETNVGCANRFRYCYVSTKTR